MALRPGTRLGSFEIIAQIGVGGMGEVYRATDTALKRSVAIKVLPEAVAADPDRLARFRREAEVLAALNHPNIAAIYGLERAAPSAGAEPAGTTALVLELVEGPTLADRIASGPIPIDEAIPIATQIAEALEAAHEQGIIHRDLKPANIKVRADGTVKVLDFGLAKALSLEGVSARAGDVAQSPTITTPAMTQAGVILGTARYMAPEQARGKPVDRRADIWAFGVLLWEMLTGQALFTGDTVTDVIGAVVTKEPDLGALPTETPGAVRRLLSRCLRKDPRKRLPDIGTARLELEEAREGTAEPSAPSNEGMSAAVERRDTRRLRWALAGTAFVIAMIAVALTFALRPGSSPAPAAVHFVVEVPQGLRFMDWGDLPVPSPDGRHVAFTGRLDGDAQLLVRSLDSPQPRSLPGTEGAKLAFWSPDSAWVAFFTDTELKKVRLAGGVVQRVCALPRQITVGGTWGSDGTILFAAGGLSATLFSVAAAGGEARPLTTLDVSRNERMHGWPQFLPGGDDFIFAVSTGHHRNDGVYLTSLAAPQHRRPVLPGSSRAVYASGYLLFVRDTTLFAQPIDPQGFVTSGEPEPVVQDVATWSEGAEWGWFNASTGGVLAYREGATSLSQLAWVDRKGGRLGTVGEPGNYRQMALSLDGRRLALEVGGEGGANLWVMDVSRGVASRVTTDSADEENPVWSPDGRELAYMKPGVGGLDLFRRILDRGASAEPLLESPGDDYPEDWSRDGKNLLYITVTEEAAIWALPLGSGGPPGLVLKTGFQVAEPRLSPDGRWLAYISDESGRYEVYIEPFRRPGERVRVSVHGAGQPRWRPDGKELYYRAFGGTLTAVAVSEVDGRPDVGPPTELFDTGMSSAPTANEYAVNADGQRFLVKVPVEKDSGARIHIVTHWTSLLER